METVKINEIKLRLATMLENARLDNEMTAYEMAKLCGIPASRYSLVVSGKFEKVTIDNLIRLNLRANTGFQLIHLAEI